MIYRSKQANNHSSFFVMLVIVICCDVVRSETPVWKSISDDGIHDPDNPALSLLQEPVTALSILPIDTAGNQVLWVRALQEGYIEPRTNIYPDTNIEVLDLDIIMPRTGSAKYVRFPHRAHTEWLDCSNCHDAIFKAKAGATPVTMLQILSGEYCGRCHGAVAFPLTECDRCHSVSSSAQPGVDKGQ
ncbi:MAG: cytochrome c3 family protein [Candidatus Thiodiazotropha lotti]|nr:cytochrome c3 family protein [Candidatus Thiodiazotropha lotti]